VVWFIRTLPIGEKAKRQRWFQPSDLQRPRPEVRLPQCGKSHKREIFALVDLTGSIQLAGYAAQLMLHRFGNIK